MSGRRKERETMSNPTEDDNRLAEDAKWGLAQADELLTRFQESHGRPARDMKEVKAWDAVRNFEKLIVPRDAVLRKYR
jgi:hypothetical protein